MAVMVAQNIRDDSMSCLSMSADTKGDTCLKEFLWIMVGMLPEPHS